MAFNKNQHYVPRVYLRPFSVLNEGKSINIFNLKRMKGIQQAPVRSQCSGDYFYGRDEKLESAINFVENSYGQIIRSITDEGAILDARTRIVLLRFSYLQYLRTEATSRKGAEMMLAVLETPGSDIPIPDMRDAMKGAIHGAMMTFAEGMSIIDDLQVCIVKNYTDTSFITSDNPSVLTNRIFLQRRTKKFGSFGVRSAGVIIILPLHPKYCAFLYDRAVYRVDHKDGWIHVKRRADIKSINDHQILNCSSNLYFKDWHCVENLSVEVSAVDDLRVSSKHTVIHAALERETEWGSYYAVKQIEDLRNEGEVLVHISANYPTPRNWPSFLHYKINPYAYSNNTREGLTRRWCVEQGFVLGENYKRIRM